MFDVVSTPMHAGRRPEIPERFTFTRPDPSQPQGPPAVADDRIELSEAARNFEDQRSGRIREALVERVRGQIADGTYLTPEKINSAIDRLIANFLGD
ncbi:MAG: flagellar biosynthesis anti-sigma factor FlgM [Planctomycetes bacterium]|nr:flagellar biosynthesis anti-sigma factor FlgM [Planctomycetota bacterium]